MDIIKQLRKQKVEISKVITNIREVQEQINVVSAKLKRTEVLADEQIYQVTNSPRLCRVVLAPTPQLTRVVACTDRQGVQGGGPRRVLPPLVVLARRASSCLCCMPGGHTLTCFVDCSCVCVSVSVCVCVSSAGATDLQQAHRHRACVWASHQRRTRPGGPC